jgi:hypothetical protein
MAGDIAAEIAELRAAIDKRNGTDDEALDA